MFQIYLVFVNLREKLTFLNGVFLKKLLYTIYLTDYNIILYLIPVTFLNLNIS